MTSRPRRDPRRTTGAPALALILVALLLLSGNAAADSSGGPSATRPLRLLAADATLIAVGRVRATERYDGHRLVVYRVRHERLVRGSAATADLGVVEIRGDSNLPPLLREGERAVLLLRPAPALSYLAEQLPAGTYLTPVDGRDGVLAVASDRECDALEHALAERAAITALDTRAAFAARRRLAFTELAAPSPRLTADAVIELTALPNLAPLDARDTEVVGRTLADPTRDPATRLALVELVAARGLRTLLPALVTAAADGAAVQGALWTARAQLGAPPSRDELGARLTGADASYRSAAVRALARLEDPDALTEVGRIAHDDPDPAVRAAAIDALGATSSPAALPMLARTFDSPVRELQQRSGQAILKIGGAAAADTLVGLALRGTSSETQTYAALLLLLSRGRDDPAVRRLQDAEPSPEVRRVIEHGIEFRDTHQH